MWRKWCVPADCSCLCIEHFVKPSAWLTESRPCPLVVMCAIHFSHAYSETSEAFGIMEWVPDKWVGVAWSTVLSGDMTNFLTSQVCQLESKLENIVQEAWSIPSFPVSSTNHHTWYFMSFLSSHCVLFCFMAVMLKFFQLLVLGIEALSV